ncbi:unnamed protein product [Diamesa tonsa]
MIRLLLDKVCMRSTLGTLSKIPNLWKNCNETRKRCFSQIAQESANNQLAKDVIIYKFENPRFFKVVNIFAISQVFFWSYLSHFSYTSLKDAPIEEIKDESVDWWRKINLGENKYRNAIAGMCLFIGKNFNLFVESLKFILCCFILGYGIIFIAWTFTLRSVRYLVLLKNAKEVSFVTYTPFGANRILNVPLRNLSAQESRTTAKTYLPIKVKGQSMFYVLDMKGEFKNTNLYDYTVGLKRKI